MPTRIEVLKGASFALTVQYKEGLVAAPIPDRYTRCTFQVRESASETDPLLLSATDDDGITIDHEAGAIHISIGATQTKALPVTGRSKIARAQVRVYDPLNLEDVPAWPPFEIVLMPEVIDD